MQTHPAAVVVIKLLPPEHNLLVVFQRTAQQHLPAAPVQVQPVRLGVHIVPVHEHKMRHAQQESPVTIRPTVASAAVNIHSFQQCRYIITDRERDIWLRMWFLFRTQIRKIQRNRCRVGDNLAHVLNDVHQLQRSLVGIKRGAAPQNIAKIGRHRRVQHIGIGQILIELHLFDCQRGRTLKRKLAGQHVIHHNTKTVDVSPVIQHFGGQLLRCHIQQRP